MLFVILVWSFCLAVEPDYYRLLSVSMSAKMILIAQPASKAKFLLDATAAKLTLDDKPTEFKNLGDYSIVHVKFEAKKVDKDGVLLDGVATEIRVLTPENPPPKK